MAGVPPTFSSSDLPAMPFRNTYISPVVVVGFESQLTYCVKLQVVIIYALGASSIYAWLSTSILSSLENAKRSSKYE